MSQTRAVHLIAFLDFFPCQSLLGDIPLFYHGLVAIVGV